MKYEYVLDLDITHKILYFIVINIRKHFLYGLGSMMTTLLLVS